MEADVSFNKYKVSPKEDRTWRGKVYASKAEMRYRRDVLNILEHVDDTITIIEQPRLHLGPDHVYVPDFIVLNDGVPYAVDVKGVETPAFKKAKKLWRKYGRIHLHIVRAKGKTKFETTEILDGLGELW
jgi:hypothetical protein